MSALLTADEAAALRVGVNVIVRLTDDPEPWVALTERPDGMAFNRPTDNCVECGGFCALYELMHRHPCPDCRDGRRIVPLYTECHACAGGGFYVDDRGEVYEDDCMEDDCESGRVLVGRGSIEVVPVVSLTDNRHLDPPFVEVCFEEAEAYWMPNVRDGVRLTLDPSPVTGRDFGIVIDCVELAS